MIIVGHEPTFKSRKANPKVIISKGNLCIGVSTMLSLELLVVEVDDVIIQKVLVLIKHPLMRQLKES